MSSSLKLGRYDYACYMSFIAYAASSLVVPLSVVAIGRTLNFPLDAGGQGLAGALQVVRAVAVVGALLACGFVAGKIGKRLTMGYSMLAMGIGIFLCAFCPTYALLLPMLFIAGIGEGGVEGIATPFAQTLHVDEAERYVNIAHSFWSVGIAVCVIVTGGLLVLGISWRIVMMVTGIMALGSSLMFFYRENPLHKYPEATSDIAVATILRQTRDIVKCGRFWVYGLAMFIGAGAEFGITFWSAAFLELTFGAGPWVAGLGTGALAVGMFIGRATFGYFATPSRLKGIMLFAALATIPVTLFLACLTPQLIPSRPMLFTALFSLLFLTGIGIAPYWPTMQVYGSQQLPHLDETMLFICFSALGIPGCGIFTWLLGLLGDRFGLRGALLLVPTSLALYAILICLEGYLFPRRISKQETIQNIV